MADEKQKPDVTFRVGRIDCSVWSNKHKEDDGTETVRRSVVLRKSYKPDKDKPEYKEYKIPLFLDELHDVVLLLDSIERQFRVDIKC